MATAETPRPGRRATWIAGGALVVVAAVIFGLSYDRSDRVVVQGDPAPRERPASDRAVALDSDARHRYATLAELVDASDLVVDGRVVAVEPGRIFGTGDAAIRSQVLTVRVNDVLAGSEGDPGEGTVVLVEEEAELADGTPVRVDGMRPGRMGDDGIWCLVASGDPDFPGYAVVNSQGRYLARGDALEGGDASDQLVRGLQARGRVGLAEAVRETAA